jgi:mono/diheme cytochrome c family protein
MKATADWRWTLPVGLLCAVAACGGGDRAGRSDTTGMTGTPPAGEAAPAPADTAMTAPAAPTPSESSAAPAAGDTAKGGTAKTGAAKADTAGKSAAAPKPAAKPAAATPKAGGAQSPQQIALGDSIFHGQVAGGTCTACHGQDAKGTAVAPNLTDSEWLNGDGSYDFIVKTITNGVPQPKQHPAPMPPKGGASLTDDQVKAAAAYVYSLSHKS